MFDIIILLIAFALTSLVSGNNLPVCAGSIIASKMVSRKSGILLTILGYIAGLTGEGRFLSGSISPLLPHSYFLIIALFVISILIFIFAYFQKIPQSLSIIFTSAIIGMDLALSIAIDREFILKLFLFWFVIPLFSIFFSLFLMKFLYKLKPTKNIWASLKEIRIFSIAAAFLTAFTLGANTFGLLLVSISQYSYTFIAMILGIIFGSIFLNKQVLKRISNEIISIRSLNSVVSQASSFIFVELATLVGVPLSNTQIFVTSLYGTAFSYKYRLLIKKTMVSIIYSWVLLIVLSIAASFIFVLLLRHFIAI